MQSIPINVKSFKIEFRLTKGDFWPQWTINQPNKLLTEEYINDYEKLVLIEIDIVSDELTIVNFGKTINSTVIAGNEILRVQSLSVNKIWANNILLEIGVIKHHAKFIPIYEPWDIKYANENQIELPQSTEHLEFYFNGSWYFKIHQPFFQWYNQLIIDNLMKYNRWVKEGTFGFIDDEHRNRLKILLDKLS